MRARAVKFSLVSEKFEFRDGLDLGLREHIPHASSLIITEKFHLFFFLRRHR